MRLILAIINSAFAAVNAFGINDLGALEIAKKNHPAIFISENVLEYTVSGVVGYIYNGEAEKCFSGDVAEKDSELYQEAELNAKKNLLAFLSKGESEVEVRISRGRKLYQFAEGNIRRVVCFVDKKDVSVSIVKPEPTNDDKHSEIPGNFNVVTNAIPNPQTIESEKIIPESSASDNRNPIEKCLRELEQNPCDCTIMSRLAKLYVRQGDLLAAKRMYSDIVKIVVKNEQIDKDFGSELLLEAGKFERRYGDANTAVKYYRLLVRCDGLRRWHLHKSVAEANRYIADLLLLAE